MGDIARRLLISSALLLGAAVVVLAASPGTSSADDTPEAAAARFTLDRGGLLRFNNGKIDVEAAYPFSLVGGPSQVPHDVAGWRGWDFPLNLEGYAEIMPDLLINRTYNRASGEQVFFTAIGSSTSRTLHKPEICYRAADWTLTTLPIQSVALEAGEVSVNRTLARSELYREERVILSWYLWRDSRRRIEDGAYVMQVAAPIVANDLDGATATAETFVRELLRRTVSSPSVGLLTLPFGR